MKIDFCAMAIERRLIVRSDPCVVIISNAYFKLYAEKKTLIIAGSAMRNPMREKSFRKFTFFIHFIADYAYKLLEQFVKLDMWVFHSDNYRIIYSINNILINFNEMRFRKAIFSVEVEKKM